MKNQSPVLILIPVYRLLLILLLLSLSVGCASFSKSRFSKISLIHEGQTKEEVIHHIGNPRKRLSQNNGEQWFYDLYSDDNSKTYPYTAIFIGEKLKSFYADSSRGSETRKLCLQRKNSDQTLVDVTGTNKAPELSTAACGE